MSAARPAELGELAGWEVLAICPGLLRPTRSPLPSSLQRDGHSLFGAAGRPAGRGRAGGAAWSRCSIACHERHRPHLCALRRRCLLIKQSGYFRFLPQGAAAGGIPAAAPAAATAGAGAGGAPAEGGAKAWKKLSGEAYVSVGRPGLVWSATIGLGPLAWVRGFAGYLRGRGSTRWKRVSLFRGVEELEGERSLGTLALLRFLVGAWPGGGGRAGGRAGQGRPVHLRVHCEAWAG